MVDNLSFSFTLFKTENQSVRKKFSQAIGWEAKQKAGKRYLRENY